MSSIICYPLSEILGGEYFKQEENDQFEGDILELASEFSYLERDFGVCLERVIAHMAQAHNPYHFRPHKFREFYTTCLDYILDHQELHKSDAFLALAFLILEQEDESYDDLKKQLFSYANEVKKKAREVGEANLASLLKTENPIHSPEDLVRLLPSGQHYRLVIDGCQQVNLENKMEAWQLYESREKNCVQAILDGVAFCSKKMNQPLSLGLLKEIHLKMTQNVEGILGKPGEWRRGQAEFCLSHIFYRDLATSNSEFDYIDQGIASIAGLIDHFGSESELKKFHHSFVVKDWQEGKLKFHIFTCEARHFKEQQIHDILDHYESQVQRLPSHAHYEKLQSIVELICLLNLEHPFQDGNGRVFAIGLLNKELMRHGFMRCICWEPNRLSLISKEEGVIELLQGMRLFHSLLATRKFRDMDENSLSCPFYLKI